MTTEQIITRILFPEATQNFPMASSYAKRIAEALRAAGLLREPVPEGVLSEEQIEDADLPDEHLPNRAYKVGRKIAERGDFDGLDAATVFMRGAVYGVRKLAPQEPSKIEYQCSGCAGLGKGHDPVTHAKSNLTSPTDHEKLIAEAREFIPAWSDGQIKSTLERLADALAAPLDPEKVAEWLGTEMPRKGQDETYGQYDRRCARALCEAYTEGKLT